MNGPFSLLPQGTSLHDLCLSAALACGTHASSVVDCYPCTPLQEGLLALSNKDAGKYILRNVSPLRPDIDLDRFTRAWEQLVDENPILRTRIVHIPNHGFMQVVLNESVSWTRLARLEHGKGTEPFMGPGQPLSSVTLVTSSAQPLFVWNIHHALYDGASLSLLLDRLEGIYHRQSYEPLSTMPILVQHIQSLNDASARSYWKSQFEDLRAVQFPSTPTNYASRPDGRIDLNMRHVDFSSQTCTISTLVKAAWAVALAHSTSSLDAVLGVVSNGRQAPIDDIESLAGPAIATIPLRLRISPELTVQDWLQDVQNRIADSIEFEQTGLSNIRRVSENAARACDFQTLLVVQASTPKSSANANGEHTLFVESANDDEYSDWQNFSSYGIVAECHLEKPGIRMCIGYDSALIGKDKIAHLSHNIENAITALSQGNAAHSTMKGLMADALSPWGLERIWKWNALIPQPSHDCIHSIVAAQTLRNPNGVAVCAWDGTLTYEQLDQRSSELALWLAQQYQVQHTIVVLLFEKSMWTAVSALAVMKAGAASVALDSKLPLDRLQTVISQSTPSRVLLCSRRNENLARSIIASSSHIIRIIDEESWESRAAKLSISRRPSHPLRTSNEGTIDSGHARLEPNSTIASMRSTVHSSYDSDSRSASSSASEWSHNSEILNDGERRRSSSSWPCSDALPTVHPSDLLYIAFTSGSTGTPKGAKVSHQNFASALRHQTQALRLDDNSRVLDFASCAFDASWYNMLFALAAGATLCVPSEHERENELAECFDRYDINWVDLTPSLARMLGAKVLSRLSTLVLGGETAVSSDTSLTGSKAPIINVYGPAECTPTATIATLTQDVTIGVGHGSCTWVVDAEGTDSLAPLGAVGELWLEGPIVGPGYLNQDDKTTAAFIENPRWLLKGLGSHEQGLGRRGRLYRTGDLVRYNDDGHLVFVGRKDNQIKIRGQRVEIGDVEHNVGISLGSVLDFGSYNFTVVGDVTRSQDTGTAVLVAYIRFENKTGDVVDASTYATLSKKLWKARQLLDQQLGQKLPSYMIPSVYVPMVTLPSTATGKIDRRRLREVGEQALREMDKSSEALESSQTNETETETLLKKIWVSVLNLSPDDVLLTKSFVRMGGDSISAMQIVSQCRLHSIEITVSDILRAGNIRNLAILAEQKQTTAPAAPAKAQDLVADGAQFELSPIQMMYFENHPKGLNHFNQSYLLQLRRPVQASRMQAAIEALVSRHAMLRARYHRDPESGKWLQSISSSRPKKAFFVHQTIKTSEEASRISQQRQLQLNICDGPLFLCDLFELPTGLQLLNLVAHHLVVDLVSWRIIWKDIEEHLEYSKFLSATSASFSTWSSQQSRSSKYLSPMSVLPISMSKPQSEFWGIPWTENTLDDVETVQMRLDKENSDLLFGRSNDALRTDALDIILGALVHSFCLVFPERTVPIIWMEGHGRDEANEPRVDISETVGWFTTIFPVPVPASRTDTLLKTIRLAKDNRRRLPGNGRPYFACRYHSEAGKTAFAQYDEAEVMLNFTGRFQQLESEEGLFSTPHFSEAHEETVGETSLLTKRSAFIEISAEAPGGIFTAAFAFKNQMCHRDRLAKWSWCFGDVLRNAVTELAEELPTLTLADVPLLNISHTAFDRVMDEQLARMSILSHQVSDIYPCSSMQEGLLLSSEKGLASYDISVTFACKLMTGAEVLDVERLEEAWNLTVQRHDALSTVFCVHPDGNGFLQVLLRDVKARTVRISSGSRSPLDSLVGMRSPDFALSKPRHCLTICSSNSGETACRLDISHALIDAASQTVLLRDLGSFYQGVELGAARSFKDVVKYNSALSRDSKVSKWRSLLEEARPCVFPTEQARSISDGHTGISIPLSERIASIKAVCAHYEVTGSVFFQVAWALVLSHFTGMRSVCFGYLASGRDIPVDGVEGTVGPILSLLISYINLDMSIDSIFAKASQDSKRHLDLQDTPLADIQKALGLAGQRLFNTSISLRSADKEETDTNRTVSFQVASGEDNHEDDIGLTVGVSANAVEASLEFKKTTISEAVATHVCDVLVSAVDFLVETHQSPSCGPSSLYQEFFHSLIGEDEEATQSFWSTYFKVDGASPFPATAGKQHTDSTDSMVSMSKSTVSLPSASLQPTVSSMTLVQAALALVAAKMSDSLSISYGITLLSSNKTLPAVLDIDWDEGVGGFLDRIEASTSELDRFSGFPLRRARKLCAHADEACGFRTVLRMMQTGAPGVDEESVSKLLKEYPLVISYDILPGAICTSLAVRSNSFDASFAPTLQAQLEIALQRLTEWTVQGASLRSLDLASPADLNTIWQWNSILSPASEECVHRIFAMRVIETPYAPAVSAWDGIISYLELDRLSTRLAQELVACGLSPGTIVPLVFEKTMWMPIAVLGVMKAGCICTLMDVIKLPQARMQAIIKQTEARIAVTSESNANLTRSLGLDQVVIIGSVWKQTTTLSLLEVSLPVVDSSSTLYIVFTSGTTSLPKGVKISHANFCSSIAHQQSKLGFNRTSRVLDSSSYAFDVVWSSLLNTLTVGGCLCIPSSSELEENLPACLEKYNITMADLSPSLLRQLGPSPGLSRLSSMILGGEGVLAADAEFAGPQTKVFNCYGPAECTPTSTIQLLRFSEPACIGYGAGLATWIVDLQNPCTLAPLGAVGELYLEGPLVGQGYLSNSDQTEASFIKDPTWLIRGSTGSDTGRRGLVYRTGDLVRYQPNGSLQFLGRRDTQLKIRGQRVELEEVEQEIRRKSSATAGHEGGEYVVEAIQPQNLERAVLAAFVSLPNASDLVEDQHSDQVRKLSVSLSDELPTVMPSYMVPSIFIPMSTIPRLPAGKIDRKQLRAIGAALTPQDISGLTRSTLRDGEGDRADTPLSIEELRLRSLWAEALKVEGKTLRRWDHFFKLGGDSLAAMKLSSLARKQRLSISVRDTFKNPTLEAMAKVVTEDW